MSYSIVYDLQAVRIDVKALKDATLSTLVDDGDNNIYFLRERLPDTTYLLLAEVGDSNCYTKDGKRARRWTTLAQGCEGDVISWAIDASKDILSGGAQVVRRPNLLPENFIKLVRATLAEALPAEAFIQAIHRKLDLVIPDEMMKPRDRVYAQTLEGHPWTDAAKQAGLISHRENKDWYLQPGTFNWFLTLDPAQPALSLQSLAAATALVDPIGRRGENSAKLSLPLNQSLEGVVERLRRLARAA